MRSFEDWALSGRVVEAARGSVTDAIALDGDDWAEVHQTTPHAHADGVVHTHADHH